MNTVTIAIDPGRQGAMAVRYPNGLINVQTFAKISFADYLDALTDVLEAAATEGWTVESVFEIPPKTLGNRVPESAAMTFGWHCGQLYGAVRALKIPVRDVRPPEYLRYPKEIRSSPVAKKRHNRDAACKLYPQLKIPVEAGDALLLLNYAVNGNPTLARETHELCQPAR